MSATPGSESFPDRLNKIHISPEATQWLRTLKARMGLTPNILCRLGLTLSLAEPGVPDPHEFSTDGAEFNRYTLLGPFDTLIVSLIRERCLQDGLDAEVDVAEQLRAHLNRGVLLLARRARNLSDLADLIPDSAPRTGVVPDAS